MMARRIPFDEWLLSGRQIFLAEGIDFQELDQNLKFKLHGAAKRRGLKLAIKTVFDPPGFVFQAYLPGQLRPILGNPTQKVGKTTHPHLFCRTGNCNNKLRPIDNENCRNHGITGASN